MSRSMVSQNRLRAIREQKGWSQAELAAAVGAPDRKTVGRWERGEHAPSSYYQEKLADLFEVSKEELGFLPSQKKTDELFLSAPDQQSQINAASSVFLSSMDKTRLSMLKRVRMRWITDVLEHSLYKQAFISLSFQEQPEAVANPWQEVVRETAQRPGARLTTGSHISEIYDEADGELLILGEPGAGKTTLLLELTRTLLERAKLDEQHPMPVVLNLSEWFEKRQSLQEWFVQELRAKYQVPAKIAHKWVESEQILFLLDGLDEVTPEHRVACIKAINLYREIHGLVPLVVCSRSADYCIERSSSNR